MNEEDVLNQIPDYIDLIRANGIRTNVIEDLLDLYYQKTAYIERVNNAIMDGKLVERKYFVHKDKLKEVIDKLILGE